MGPTNAIHYLRKNVQGSTILAGKGASGQGLGPKRQGLGLRGLWPEKAIFTFSSDDSRRQMG